MGGYDVERIGLCAFEYNTLITGVTIPDTVKIIEDSVFLGCSELESVIIPDSVVSIDYNAFKGCTSLSEITLPDSIVNIGWGAFSDCTNLIDVKLPKNLSLLESSLFSGCENLSEITIPESVESIGNSAFLGCTSLNNVEIPQYVSVIDGSAFYECTSLDNIYLPDSVDIIGAGAFYGCSALTDITVPPYVSSIGNSAFANCPSLETVILHPGVYDMGDGIFDRDTALKTITYRGSEKRWNRLTQNLDSDFTNGAEIQFVALPLEAEYEWMYDYRISDGGAIITGVDPSVSGSVEVPQDFSARPVIGIDDSAFKDRSLITEISFPNTVTFIGDNAFSGCSLIESVSFSDQLTSIGTNAFLGCTSLTDISLPSSVTNIKSSAFDNTAFYNDSSNWENGVLYIGTNLIEADKSYQGDYEIKQGTKCIAEYAFRNCDLLTGIVVPDSVEFIGNYAFFYCAALKSITLPDSLSKIEASTFTGSAYYENKDNWENGVLYIGNYLITADQDITEYAVKEGTACIADSAFINCSLESIIIPEGVAYIGENAFMANENLTDIVIPKGVTQINDGTFADCVNLVSVTLPWNVNRIGDGAFSNCQSLGDIYFSNTHDAWKKVIIGSDNYYLYGAEIHQGTPGSSEYFKDGMYTYIKLKDGGIKITDCDDFASGDIEIPSTLGGYDVVRIGYGIFEDNTKITSVLRMPRFKERYHSR